MSKLPVTPYPTLFSSYADNSQSFHAWHETVTEQPLDKQVESIKQLVKQTDYTFIAQNKRLFERKFEDLFAVLKQDKNNVQAFWLHALYCSLLLHSYYDTYGKTAEAARYEKLSQDFIQYYLQGTTPPVEASVTWLDKIKTDLAALLATPLHTSSIRQWVGFINMQRLSLVFGRIATTELIKLAQSLHALDSMEQLVGFTFHLSNIKKTIPLFNALSVGLFAVRFSLNFSLMMRHTLFDKEGTASERFVEEFKARYWVMTNDIVWLIVNGLTNFSSYFHVPGPVAAGLLSGFLLFDTLWMWHLLAMQKSVYEQTRAAYLSELLLLGTTPARYAILKMQLARLEQDGVQQQASFEFCRAAAALLCTGFTLSLCFPPALAPAFYLICAVASSMYLSYEQYGAYRKQAWMEANDPCVANHEAMQAAWDTFTFTMAKNLTMPIVIMGVCAVSIPAALCIMTLYLGIEYAMSLPKTSAEELPPASPLSLEEDQVPDWISLAR